MIQIVLKKETAPFEWIDLNAPTHEELHKIADEYGLHPKLVEDCLDPEHLPKFEKYEDVGFLITRTFDPDSRETADNVQGLTRKIAVFYSSEFLITIHRAPLQIVTQLIHNWTNGSRPQNLPATPLPILVECLSSVIESYEKPLDREEAKYEAFEGLLFANREVVPQLKAIHQVKQRLSVFRRLLWHTLGAMQKVPTTSSHETALFQDLRENAEACYLFADDLLESLDALVHTQLAIASHRTNEIVRILTLFSVFFMPLTFLAGIYGMNFHHMPELDWHLGYPAVLLTMAFISLGIFLWFKKRGYFR